MSFLELVLAALFISMIVIYSVWIVLFFRPRKRQWPASKNPPVSVVVPAYNEGPYIQDTLKYILAAEYAGEKEIIVVDDGSTDDTRKKVEALAAVNPNIKILSANHEGKAAAINLATQKASGEVIVAIDADSRLAADALAKIVEPFADERVGGVSGIIRAVSNNRVIVWFQDFEYVLSSVWRRIMDNANSTYILPGFAAFRRAALLKVGGLLSDTQAEDFEVGVRLRKAGHTLAMTEATIYTQVPQTLTALTRQRMRWGRGTIQVIRKHRDVPFNPAYGGMGLIGIPTQLYWIIHGLVNIPLTFYQIARGYILYFATQGDLLSIEVAKYLFSWLSAYGILEYSYKTFTGQWAMSTIFPLIVATFTLNMIYNMLALQKMHAFTLKNFFVILFFFPYSLYVLSMYILPLFREILVSRKKDENVNVWTK